MDAYQTHGAFSWSELSTTDPQKATEFYGTLFGWKVETSDMGSGPYHVVKIGDTSVGGIMSFPPGMAGVPPHWCPYVTVDDVDKTIETCVRLGGRLCAGPMDIPQVGRFAAIADPQGAVLNVITYLPPA